MLFNSPSFLLFFTIVAALYYLLRHQHRWMLLVAASFWFYASLDVRLLPLLLGVTAVAYAAGLRLERSEQPRGRRLLFAAAVIVLIAPLGARAVPALGWAAAAGLSFYTFSAVSYLVDVYTRRIAAERHAGYFTVYIAFFPKLLAGPIERAKPFLAQIREPAAFSDAGVTAGLQLMLVGLVKKVVIADRLAVFVNQAYSQPAFAAPADLAIATYFFAFQIYCDFSGYSDIARGAARVLGIDLMENFRRPYLAVSPPEFWSRRWHLSLTAWFRDYVYIPLGGSRVPRWRQIANVMIVFLASGLWHGMQWTFLVWGGLNGLYVAATTMMPRGRRAAGDGGRTGWLGSAAAGVVTFHLILITWVFFRAGSVGDALTILSRVGAALAALPGAIAARVQIGEMPLSLLLIALLLILEIVDEKQRGSGWLAAWPAYVRWSAYYALLAALLVIGVWNQQQFVYMQF